MGGKSATTSQALTIPPDVLARYNSVNTQAQTAAAQPFQTYSTDPNAFVAPINAQQQAGMTATNAAANQAQPYFDAATGALTSAGNAAMPYYGTAANDVTGAQGVGGLLGGTALQSLNGGSAAAAPLQGQAANDFTGAYSNAQPYNQAALGAGVAGAAAAAPLYGEAASNLTGAQDVGSALSAASLGTLGQAGASAAPLQSSAAQGIAGAAPGAQPYNTAAVGSILSGLGAAQPLQGFAQGNIANAQAGAQPYQALATQYGLAGGQAVNPTTLDSNSINQYMSPYLQSVLAGTLAPLQQQQQIDQSTLSGNQIAAGAFGGDRGKIAKDVLAGQQEMATGNVVSQILNQGYNTALSTAQQQQGVGLGAAQANRTALQQTDQNLLGIGQQGFGQGITTAQAQAALGQQEYGQGLGAGQALAGVGQQQYGQQLGSAQAQAELGQQVYGQGANTAAQQAAVAQQLYGQGANTAAQQAALGQGLYGIGSGLSGILSGVGQQQYGQAVGAGTAEAGLGQQLFGQGATTATTQADIGNQLYNQGIGAAQQQQNIGQGIFGVGSGVSSDLANLGTGAQGAALQGAQAQIGVGTVAQQTQQAGQTALYNQFLQQQGYPFQVAQFLANIAMGTGALSGSTTTTQQPTPFFSDARLKDDMEPIGETYDGQKIVKFRYKGDKQKQIGLVAQDVEQHHPDAVGLSQGYKTVDYDAATKDAANRGHFYSGGVVPFPARGRYAQGGSPSLIDPETLAAIIQAQLAMYGGAGIPGLVGGGTPGQKGFVPAAGLPTPSLATPAPPPDLPQSGGLKQGLDAGAQLADLWKTGKGAYDDLHKDKPFGSDSTNDDGTPQDNYRGGLVRGHYDTGGLPYSQAQDPYVPTDETKPKKPDDVLKPKTASGDAPESGFGQVMDAVGDVAKVAALFAARGGRIGYADGGATDDDDSDLTPAQIARNAIDAKNRAHDTSAASGLWNDITGGVGNAYNAVMDAFVRPSGDQKAVTSAPPPAAKHIVSRETMRPKAAPNKAGLAPPLEDRGFIPTAPTPQPLAEAPQPVAGLSAATTQNGPLSAPPTPDGLSPQGAPDQAPTATPAPDKKPGQPDWMGRNEDWLVPLLSGVGAMASSPSLYAGSALLQGAGAAAGAYQNTKQKQLERQKAAVEIGTGQIGQEAENTALKYNDITLDKNGNTIVYMPDGNYIKYGDWQARGMPPTYHMVNGITQQPLIPQNATGTGKISASSVPAGGASVPRIDIGPAGDKQIQNDYNVYTNANVDTKKSIQDASSSEEKYITDGGIAASDALRQEKQMAVKLMQQPDTGPEAGGVLFDYRNKLVSSWNDLMNTLGHPEGQLDPQGQIDNTVLNKMTNLTAFAQAGSSDERSLQALRLALSSVPNPNMPKPAALKVIATNMINHLKATDQLGYLQNYRQSVINNTGNIGAYNARGAQTAFLSEPQYSDTQYGKMHSILERMLLDKNGQALFTKIMNGQYSPAAIDKAFEKPENGGVSGMSRLFTGSVQ